MSPLPSRILCGLDSTPSRITGQLTGGLAGSVVKGIPYAQAERYGARLAALESEEGRVLEWARKGHIEEAAMLSQIDRIRAERRDLSAASNDPGKSL